MENYKADFKAMPAKLMPTVDPDNVREFLKPLLDATRKQCFVAEYQQQATDAEVVGMLLAKFFCWDGVQVLEATYAALEDANFHTENRTIEKMLEDLKGKYPKLGGGK
jgi:hypothetical protein